MKFEDIELGITAVRLDDDSIGMVTKAFSQTEMLAQVPGEELERQFDPQDVSPAPGALLLEAAVEAYGTDVIRRPRYFALAASLGVANQMATRAMKEAP